MSRKGIAGLLLAALVACGVAACGPGNQGGLPERQQDPPSQPTTITVATGTITTDDWGYTGVNALQLAAPAETAVRVEGHTLLQNAAHAVISGPSTTTVIYSSDATTLPAAAQSALPGSFVSYLQILIGDAKTATPALSASVASGALATGTSVNVYRYDFTTGTWTAAQGTTVSGTGAVAFRADQMGIYGVFQ